MGLKNPGLESSWLKSLRLKSQGLKSSWLKSLGLKGLELKLGVEKSGVEMSFNRCKFLTQALQRVGDDGRLKTPQL